MAGVRKSTAKVSAVKEEVKPEVLSEEKAAKEAPAKKTAAKKTTVRKTPVRKTATRKEETVKEETVKAAEKAAVTETVNFQFGGKSYTPEDLLKSCKDVWKYDLGGKEEDIKSIELYVKPEENSTYYVINGDVTGSFFI